MNIEIGTRLAGSNGLNGVVASRLPIIHELLDEFRTANTQSLARTIGTATSSS